jgi:hypothetical protein
MTTQPTFQEIEAQHGREIAIEVLLATPTIEGVQQLTLQECQRHFKALTEVTPHLAESLLDHAYAEMIRIDFANTNAFDYSMIERGPHFHGFCFGMRDRIVAGWATETETEDLFPGLYERICKYIGYDLLRKHNRFAVIGRVIGERMPIATIAEIANAEREDVKKGGIYGTPPALAYHLHPDDLVLPMLNAAAKRLLANHKNHPPLAVAQFLIADTNRRRKEGIEPPNPYTLRQTLWGYVLHAMDDLELDLKQLRWCCSMRANDFEGDRKTWVIIMLARMEREDDWLRIFEEFMKEFVGFVQSLKIVDAPKNAEKLRKHSEKIRLDQNLTDALSVALARADGDPAMIRKIFTLMEVDDLQLGLFSASDRLTTLRTQIARLEEPTDLRELAWLHTTTEDSDLKRCLRRKLLIRARSKENLAKLLGIEEIDLDLFAVLAKKINVYNEDSEGLQRLLGHVPKGSVWALELVVAHILHQDDFEKMKAAHEVFRPIESYGTGRLDADAGTPDEWVPTILAAQHKIYSELLRRFTTTVEFSWLKKVTKGIHEDLYTEAHNRFMATL